MVEAKRDAGRTKVQTVGQVRLREWLHELGHSQEQLGDLLKVSQAAVSHWSTGTARPELHHRISLSRATGISVDDWMTPGERAKAALGEPKTGTEG